MIVFAARAACTPPIDSYDPTRRKGATEGKTEDTPLNKPAFPRAAVSYTGTPLATPGPQPNVKARAYTKLFIKTNCQKVYIQSTTP